MLKFQFVEHLDDSSLVKPDVKAQNPEFWTQPYRLTVTRGVSGPGAGYLYTHQDGCIKLVFNTYRMSDRVNTIDDYSPSEEHKSLYEYFKGCLFYYTTEYNLDFLNGRYAQDLNEIMDAFTAFDQGAIWQFLRAVNLHINKYLLPNVLNGDKTLRKFASSIRGFYNALDKGIGLTSKMMMFIHDDMERRIRDGEVLKCSLDDYTVGRTFILQTYLVLLPIKEAITGLNCGFSDTYTMTDFLHDCIGSTPKSMKCDYEDLYGAYKTSDFISSLVGKNKDKKLNLAEKAILMYKKQTNPAWKLISTEETYIRGSETDDACCRVLRGGKLILMPHTKLQEVIVEDHGVLCLHELAFVKNITVKKGGWICVWNRAALTGSYIHVEKGGIVSCDTHNLRQLILDDGVTINPPLGYDPDKHYIMLLEHETYKTTPINDLVNRQKDMEINKFDYQEPGPLSHLIKDFNEGKEIPSTDKIGVGGIAIVDEKEAREYLDKGLGGIAIVNEKEAYLDKHVKKPTDMSYAEKAAEAVQHRNIK